MAASMQFWGAEVKAKEPCEVSLVDGSLIHLSQITLGDIKKDDETVTVRVKVGEKKLVLAMLNKKNPQQACDLVFDEDFEISHNWKNGNIHLLGYQSESMELDSEIDSSDEELEYDIPIAKENGQLAGPAAIIAPAVMPKAADKSKPEVEGDSDDDGSSDEEFLGDDSEDVDSEEGGTSDSDSESESPESESESPEDEDDSEEETPAKVVDADKKRPNTDAETPPQSKKAKIATPQKTDGKKGGQPTTLSSKKGGKTPGGDKTPKSGGSDVSCGSCKKSFKSGGALESHNKSKHGAK